MRLGTENLTMSELGYEAAKRKITIEDIAAIPENDEWEYHGFKRDGKSMVCSTFIAAMWKEAGLFAPFKINAHEFAP